MLIRVELICSTGQVSLKNVRAVAFGDLASRVLCPDFGKTERSLGSGKLYVLCDVEKTKLIRCFYHTSGVLSGSENVVSILAGKISELKEEMVGKVQIKLITSEFGQFLSKRNEGLDRVTWLEDSKELFESL